jgi:hypothetical protein
MAVKEPAVNVLFNYVLQIGVTLIGATEGVGDWGGDG